MTDFDESLKRLAETFRKHRVDRGFSREQLAERLNVDISVIEVMETEGDVPLNVLFDFCQVLSVRPAELL